MKLFTSLYLFLCFCFTAYSAGEQKNVSTDPNPESTIREIFTDYQKALTTRDPAFPEKWFITDEEYKQLLDYVAKKQPNCIGSDESGFRSENKKKAYNDHLSSELVINKIDVNKIEYNSS
jgi:hypothetical protein